MIERIEIKARREEGWRRMFDATLIEHERSLEVKLKRFFMKQNAEITAALSRGKKARSGDWFDDFTSRARSLDPNADIGKLRNEINDALGGVVDWDRQRVNLDGLLRPARAQAFSSGAETARAAYGLQAVRAPELTRGMLDSGFAKLAQSDEITETTRGLLARSVANGIAAGEGRGELIARVQEYMPHVSNGRAAVIATTEAHAAISMGNYQQMAAAGFASKRWKATLDGNTRDAHREMSGEEVPMDKPFSNGLMFPGDPSGPPGQIINCRCVLIPGNKVRKPTRTQIQRPAAGLGSGSDADRQLTSYKKTRVNVEPETYNSKAPEELDKTIRKYENKIVNADVEHAYVFVGGRVYHAEGVAGRVHPEKILELGGLATLEGATIIHNHPQSESNLSFGLDDIEFAVGTNLHSLGGFDKQFRYWLTGLENVKLPEGQSIGMIWSKHYNEVLTQILRGELPRDVLYHETANRVCKSIGIRYKREARL